jgi:hypothetical protein
MHCLAPNAVSLPNLDEYILSHLLELVIGLSVFNIVFSFLDNGALEFRDFQFIHFRLDTVTVTSSALR